MKAAVVRRSANRLSSRSVPFPGPAPGQVTVRLEGPLRQTSDSLRRNGRLVLVGLIRPADLPDRAQRDLRRRDAARSG